MVLVNQSDHFKSANSMKIIQIKCIWQKVDVCFVLCFLNNSRVVVQFANLARKKMNGHEWQLINLLSSIRFACLFLFFFLLVSLFLCFHFSTTSILFNSFFDRRKQQENKCHKSDLKVSCHVILREKKKTMRNK